MWGSLGTWLWTFGKGVQPYTPPAPPQFTNDELVEAYEWVTWGGALGLPDLRFVDSRAWLLDAPNAVRATLHMSPKVANDASDRPQVAGRDELGE